MAGLLKSSIDVSLIAKKIPRGGVGCLTTDVLLLKNHATEAFYSIIFVFVLL